MSRVISLLVLLGLVIVTGILFFQVMFRFFLPMFVALILVVMFRPLHEWFRERCRGRDRVAALLTTSTILLMVLLPLAVILYMAAVEITAQTRNLNITLLGKLQQLRTQLHLDLPPDEIEGSIEQLENELEQLARQLVAERDAFQPGAARPPLPNPVPRVPAGQAVAPGDAPADPPATAAELFAFVERDLAELRSRMGIPPGAPEDALASRPDWLAAASLGALVPSLDQMSAALGAMRREHTDLEQAIRQPPAAIEPAATEGGDSSPLGEADPEAPEEPSLFERYRRHADRLEDLMSAHRRVRAGVYGSELMHQVKQFVRLDTPRIEELTEQFTDWAAPQLVSLPSKLGGYVGGAVIGLIVMIISLYYFLADGPGMIKTTMLLLQLDARYEQQILSEFDKVSRAVVVATLLAAFVQGILAGIGYWFAGIESVFLLTVVTMLLAMVPFVGAFSVWSLCCLWLFFDGHFYQATFLGIYGACIISTADNIIKPIVLHGQSNLHPLLALLSVLGGVQALGPIGIFVGPMVVAFMQAALNMLRAEVTRIDKATDVRPSPET